MGGEAVTSDLALGFLLSAEPAEPESDVTSPSFPNFGSSALDERRALPGPPAAGRGEVFAAFAIATPFAGNAFTGCWPVRPDVLPFCSIPVPDPVFVSRPLRRRVFGLVKEADEPAAEVGLATDIHYLAGYDSSYSQ